MCEKILGGTFMMFSSKLWLVICLTDGFFFFKASLDTCLSLGCLERGILQLNWNF